MSYSLGLTYKPKISKKVDDLLTRGALVHMFEFKSQMHLLNNFCNALVGKDTGPYSSYREVFGPEEGEEMNFNEDKQIFQALPTSAVRKEFPFSLYTNLNNVGVLIDPEKVDFIAIGPGLITNYAADKTTMYFNNINFFNDPHFYNVNLGKDAIEMGDDAEKTTCVDIFRSAEDKAALKKLFKEYFWEKYTGGVKADSPGIFKHIKTAMPEIAKLGGFDPRIISEIVANVPRDAVKGIIFCPNRFWPEHASYLPARDMNMQLNGMVEAVLVKQFVQQKLKIDLPIIRYHEPEVDNSGDIITKPAFSEVKVEMRKVRQVLKTDPTTSIAYDYVLGAAHTSNIINGKTCFHIEM